MTRTLKSQFLRFSAAGVAGLLVDTATLYAALWLGAGLYTGRVVSYLTAATSTWALNRRFTFGDPNDNSGKLAQWAKFLAANSLGGIVNYSVYAALVSGSHTVASMPFLGVCAGSISGLTVNFVLSRNLVFRQRNAERLS